MLSQGQRYGSVCHANIVALQLGTKVWTPHSHGRHTGSAGTREGIEGLAMRRSHLNEILEQLNGLLVWMPFRADTELRDVIR